MATVRVVTDSTADIPTQLATALDITVIPDEIIFGQQSYRDGIDITLKRFLELLATNPHFPKTAQPGLGTFLDTYRRLGQDRAEIVSIHVGYHLSGMVRTAQAAAAELSSEVRVAVVDSHQLSMAQGWQVVAVAHAVQQGVSFDQAVALAQQLPPLAHATAMLDSLDFVRRGGRIGRLAALLGAALRVKPLINVVDGHPALLEKVRTQGKALKRLVELVAARAPFLSMAVLHVAAPEAAASLVDRLSAFLPPDQILVREAGVAVATHLGPGAVGVCLMSDNRTGIDPGLFQWKV